MTVMKAMVLPVMVGSGFDDCNEGYGTPVTVGCGFDDCNEGYGTPCYGRLVLITVMKAMAFPVTVGSGFDDHNKGYG